MSCRTCKKNMTKEHHMFQKTCLATCGVFYLLGSAFFAYVLVSYNSFEFKSDTIGFISNSAGATVVLLLYCIIGWAGIIAIAVWSRIASYKMRKYVLLSPIRSQRPVILVRAMEFYASIGLFVVLASICYYVSPINPCKATNSTPYLSLTTEYATSSMQINIRTKKGTMRLFYKRNDTDAWRSTVFNRTDEDGYLMDSGEDNGSTDREVAMHYRTALLTDLSPGTEYTYTIGKSENDRPLYQGTFKTAAPTSNKVFVFSDLHRNFAVARYLALRIRHENPVAILSGGDLVSYGSGESDWRVLMKTKLFQEFAHRPLIAASGNHESYGYDLSPHDRHMFRQVFPNYAVMRREPDTNTSLPDTLLRFYNESLLSMLNTSVDTFDEGMYYHVVVGNIAYVVLDPLQTYNHDLHYNLPMGNFLSIEQLRWLDGILTELNDAQDIRHIVMVCHFPLYSSGETDGSELLTSILEPIICHYGVSAIITGHEHFYEAWYSKDLCKAYDSNHSFYHFIIGAAGGPTDFLMSPFFKGRQWSGPIVRIADEPERYSLVRKRDYQVIGRINYHYMTIETNVSHGVFRTYNVLTGSFEDEFAILG